MSTQATGKYTAGSPFYTTETVTYLHATARRYSDAPNGASYVEIFQCIHNHPDTDRGVAAVHECGERLVRVLPTGRVPSWARQVQ